MSDASYTFFSQYPGGHRPPLQRKICSQQHQFLLNSGQCSRYGTAGPGRNTLVQRSLALFGLLLLLAAPFQSVAGVTVFPVATNASVAELAGGVGFDGTNYLVGLLSSTNVS